MSAPSLYTPEQLACPTCTRPFYACDCPPKVVIPFHEAIDPNQPWNARRNPEGNMMNLPPLEVVCDRVHAAWMDSKRAQGVQSRQAEDGEELMVPYSQLSEKAKDLDRGTVRAVYAAINEVS